MGAPGVMFGASLARKGLRRLEGVGPRPAMVLFFGARALGA